MRHLDRNAKIRHLKQNWTVIKELHSISKFTITSQEIQQFDSGRAGKVLSCLENLDLIELWNDTTPKRYKTGSLKFEKAERLVSEAEP